MSVMKQLLDHLVNGKVVALWGASNDAIPIINELKKQRVGLPKFIIDSDINKQGKLFLGIPIMAFESAFRNDPDMYVYIVPSNYLFQVIGTLLSEYHFSSDHIINYEPVVFRRGCMFVENAILCVDHSLRFCSSDFGKNTSPKVDFNGDYIQTIDEWKSLKERFSNSIANGLPSSCEGCVCITEDWFAKTSSIRIINYSEGGVCNFNCCYCNATAKDSKGTFEEDIDLAKMLDLLQQRGMIGEGLHIDYSPGEPALHKLKKSNYDSFGGKYTTLIMTNGSIYDDGIAECLAKGKATLCVSTDAGTPETYKAVKGLDLYPKVCDNLLRYSQLAEGAVGLKYIFIPDKNDTIENMDGFLQLCSEVKPGIVLLSYDIFFPVQTMTASTFEMVKYVTHRLDEKGIVWKNVSDVIARAFSGVLI